MKINLLTGTIFQDTKLPLRTWFREIWDIVRKKHGASALSMGAEFGVNYKTAWSMAQKLGRAMVAPVRSKLNGIVEVDETFLGGLEEGVPGRGSQKNLGYYWS
jgi:hypothetical protein